MPLTNKYFMRFSHSTESDFSLFAYNFMQGRFGGVGASKFVLKELMPHCLLPKYSSFL